MVGDVGKTIASMKLIDGSVVNFYNGVYSPYGESIDYYTPYNELRYSLGIDSTALTNKFRCCHFVVSNPQSQMSGEKPKVLPCLSGTSQNSAIGASAHPLWQFISPTINKLSADEYQISWWSNVTSSPDDGNGYYTYNSDTILKFKQDDLENANQYQNQTAGKILCTASIHWQNLKYSNASGNVGNADAAVMTPVIYNPVIVAYITGQGLITDFSTGGGGGGGNSIHGHTSNEDCGFAAAVFMPSANMRVLNWR